MEKLEGEQAIDTINSSKSAFDGRLKFFEHAQAIKINITNAALNSNYITWIKSLKILRGLIAGYVTNDKIITIKDDIDRVQQQIIKVHNTNLSTKNKNNINLFFDNKLQDITDTLYIISKDLWLPVKEEDDDEEFDIKKFRKESDL